ncbi:SOS response-associated peptidase family protein [Paraburkholderia kururiensis]|uniref:Abasic site processing protein n=1 Tax=Paraburkholderia kururiensis TaxID=984307 RepID=A0ABZ0WHW8_9BURK|nr:SOS response-associated peptidase family protein [Paraburkholderia kururiensis]WQD76928.1 SOS response-associated peptidase family protein [Paraburkholderia kururiensis]
MYGRYARTQFGAAYAAALTPGLPDDEVEPLFDPAPYDDAPSWNIIPGCRQLILYRESSRCVRWGYLPPWAAALKIRPLSHARLERLSTGVWSGLLADRRVIIPCDHWYESIRDDDGAPHSFAVRRANGGPVWMAGLSSMLLHGEEDAESGFVVVSSAADGGPAAAGNSRPVVFSLGMAKAWLDPHTPLEQANCFAQEAGLPVDAFEWHRVSSRVRTRYVDDASVMEPDREPSIASFIRGTRTPESRGALARATPQPAPLV